MHYVWHYNIADYKIFLFQTALQDRKAGFSPTMEKELRFQNLFYAEVLASFVGITPLEDLGQKKCFFLATGKILSILSFYSETCRLLFTDKYLSSVSVQLFPVDTLTNSTLLLMPLQAAHS